MVKSVNSLIYQAISSVNNKGVVQLVIDGSVDKSWVISLLGSVQGAPENVQPAFVSIDNIAYPDTVTVQMGSFIYQVPGFYRETFSIPDGCNTLNISVTAVTTALSIIISEDRIAADAGNQLAVQKYAVTTLIYSAVYYNVDANQPSSDVNKNTIFTKAGNQLYNLMDPSVAGNGWYQLVRCFGGGLLSIVPPGAATINGLFTGGSPLTLFPGDSGYLISDGVSWFYSGKTSWVSQEIGIFGGGTLNLIHRLGKIPRNVHYVMRCKVSELSYAVGLELTMPLNTGSAFQAEVDTLAWGPQTVYIMEANNGHAWAIPNAATGVLAVFTPANWVKVIYASVDW